jgi:predicted N-formylglutamate amidohydrolase
MPGTLIITCEHAGNQVPVRYRDLFTDEVLASHRGWDPGALDIAVSISETLAAPCFTHQTTRLLVETNRSLGSNQLFSEFSNALADEDKQMILDKYYFPFRLRVEKAIAFAAKPVFHFSIHSFTPALEGVVRTTDVGILFDPARGIEKETALAMSNTLILDLSGMRIDFNEPYKGVDDGFTTYLRTRFSEDEYCGIEVEVNQKHVQVVRVATALIKAIAQVHKQVR